MLTAESIGDVSIGLAGRSVLNRFGRLGQSVETTLLYRDGLYVRPQVA